MNSPWTNKRKKRSPWTSATYSISISRSLLRPSFIQSSVIELPLCSYKYVKIHMPQQLAFLNKNANTPETLILVIWLNLQKWIPERVTYYSKGTDIKMIKPSAVTYRWHIIFLLLYMSLYNQDTWRITYQQITTWQKLLHDIRRRFSITPNRT